MSREMSLLLKWNSASDRIYDRRFRISRCRHCWSGRRGCDVSVITCVHSYDDPSVALMEKRRYLRFMHTELMAPAEHDSQHGLALSLCEGGDRCGEQRSTCALNSKRRGSKAGSGELCQRANSGNLSTLDLTGVVSKADGFIEFRLHLSLHAGVVNNTLTIENTNSE